MRSTNELKQLSITANQSIEKLKERKLNKPSKSKSIHRINEIRQKQLRNILKQTKVYEKEITELKKKMEYGDDKVAEFQWKLEESLTTTAALRKLIKELTHRQTNQSQELTRLIEKKEYELKIDTLNDELTRLKYKLRRVRERVVISEQNLTKARNNLLLIEEKYNSSNLKKEVTTKLSKVEVKANNEYNIAKLKDDIEILRISLNKDRTRHKKEQNEIKVEIISLRQMLRNIEQENKLNAMKVKDLRRVVELERSKTPIRNKNKIINRMVYLLLSV